MVRLSSYLFTTSKQLPADAVLPSHKFMLKAGMIKQVSSGIYSFLPIGFRSYKKIENIIREEMNRSGAMEILMPSVLPSEIWKKTKRWQLYGSEMLKFKDRQNREYCYGPTHEEMVTVLVNEMVNSYKQLPLIVYQIQTKFRDEIRPRFGLMRAREFIMKDAYSFAANEEQLDENYETMYKTYCRIFDRLQVEYIVVNADSGAIGGNASQEFMVVAQNGEDKLLYCTCGYAANVEKAETILEESISCKFKEEKEIDTGSAKTIEEVSNYLGVSTKCIAKSVLYKVENKLFLVLIRGDRQVNEVKLKNYIEREYGLIGELEIVKEELKELPAGNIGPFNLPSDIEIILDYSLKTVDYVVVGANKEGKHIVGVKVEKLPGNFVDILLVEENDLCPKCKAKLIAKRGIEVGHIFKLGTKYSQALNATFVDENGKNNPFIMGCYGIGVSRTLAAIIEQSHDKYGPIFPRNVAPFEVIILPLKPQFKTEAEKIYENLMDAGVDVALDDRDKRPGFKFNDADLMGVPIKLIIGKSFEENNEIELKLRKNNEVYKVNYEDDYKKKIKELLEEYKIF